MLISPEEMQKRRSPRELREFAESVRAAVPAEPAEFELGMTKKGSYKEFLDEILPLSHFGEQHYPDTYTLQPVLGNQGYDAIVYDESGAEHERLEITNPHDGAEAANAAKLVVNRGFGPTKVGNPGDDLDALIPRVVSACQAKALKDYRDCTLVVVVTAQPPFAGFENRYEEQMKELAMRLCKIKFNAQHVALLIPPNRVIQVM